MKSYQDAKALLNGRQTKKLANNTYARLEEGNVIIKLHNTDIITCTPRKVILNTGGWFTITTKERLNRYAPCHIYQTNSIWYIANPNTFDYDWQDITNPIFYDGLELKYSGEVYKKCLKFGDKRKREVFKIKKQVKAYLQAMQKEFNKNGIPKPDGGDCLVCKGLHGKSGPDCLTSHLKEKYVHGTLIVNALIARGYQNPGVFYQLKLYSSIKQAVRRYFYRQLKIA